MKAKNLCVYAGLCAGVASMAVGQSNNQTPELVTASEKVQPIQLAQVKMVDGKVIFQSDWMPYTGNTSRNTDDHVRIFDCFGDLDSDHFMDDSVCGHGSGRWTFGSAFSNLFYTNDMVLASDTDLTQGSSAADFGWFWTAGGSGTSEDCVILLFTQESEPCDDDSGDYSGWILDFGSLASGVRSTGNVYYFTNILLTTGSWPLPTDGAGSYMMIFGQEVTTSGAIVMATLAQPALWATGDAGGAPDNRGSQAVQQFDELGVPDLIHTSSECITSNYTQPDLCPTVWGGMMQFWGAVEDACYADCDGNGTVNTLDFLCFLGLWSSGDPLADCDGNGTVNTLDFLCFLGLWSAGC